MAPLKMGTMRWIYMPYFKPTINFDMLQYIISSDTQVSDPLQVSSIVMICQ